MIPPYSKEFSQINDMKIDAKPFMPPQLEKNYFYSESSEGVPKTNFNSYEELQSKVSNPYRLQVVYSFNIPPKQFWELRLAGALIGQNGCRIKEFCQIFNSNDE